MYLGSGPGHSVPAAQDHLHRGRGEVSLPQRDHLEAGERLLQVRLVSCSPVGLFTRQGLLSPLYSDLEVCLTQKLLPSQEYWSRVSSHQQPGPDSVDQVLNKSY